MDVNKQRVENLLKEAVKNYATPYHKDMDFYVWQGEKVYNKGRMDALQEVIELLDAEDVCVMNLFINTGGGGYRYILWDNNDSEYRECSDG